MASSTSSIVTGIKFKKVFSLLKVFIFIFLASRFCATPSIDNYNGNRVFCCLKQASRLKCHAREIGETIAQLANQCDQ